MAKKKKRYLKSNKKTMRNGYTPSRNNTYKENIRNDIIFGKTKRNMIKKGETDPNKWSAEFKNLQRTEKTKEFSKNRLYIKKKNFKLVTQPKEVTLKPRKTKKRKKIKYKKTILDFVAENRSREEIYNISNKISKGVMIFVKNSDLSESTINFIRSGLTLLISEGINKMFEEQLSFVEKVELFFNISKVVYKVVVKLNKNKKKYSVDYKYKKATILDTVAYANFKKNRNRELDKYFDYNLTTITALNKVSYNKMNCYILFIIRYDKKWVVIKKKDKNEFITTRCRKEKLNIESAYKYFSNELNIDNVKLVEIDNFTKKNKEVLTEYLVFYTDINRLSDEMIVIDEIDESIKGEHLEIYNNYKNKILND